MKQIRRAEGNELIRVVELSKKWEEEGITYGLKANSIDDLQLYLEQEFWVVVDNDEIIGYLLGQVKTNEGYAIFDKLEKTFFEIDEIYIEAKHRKRNIGTELINVVLKSLQELGIERTIVSSANKELLKTLGFYEKNGFKNWTITFFK